MSVHFRHARGTAGTRRGAWPSKNRLAANRPGGSCERKHLQYLAGSLSCGRCGSRMLCTASSTLRADAGRRGVWTGTEVTRERYKWADNAMEGVIPADPAVEPEFKAERTVIADALDANRKVTRAEIAAPSAIPATVPTAVMPSVSVAALSPAPAEVDTANTPLPYLKVAEPRCWLDDESQAQSGPRVSGRLLATQDQTNTAGPCDTT